MTCTPLVVLREGGQLHLAAYTWLMKVKERRNKEEEKEKKKKERRNVWLPTRDIRRQRKKEETKKKRKKERCEAMCTNQQTPLKVFRR